MSGGLNYVRCSPLDIMNNRYPPADRIHLWPDPDDMPVVLHSTGGKFFDRLQVRCARCGATVSDVNATKMNAAIERASNELTSA